MLTGPTASGKTSFSYALADHFSCQIINADSRQIYRPLTVGTAKPDLSSVPVPHHLFDLFDTPQPLNVTDYFDHAKRTCDDFSQQGITPLFVGGSMFYLKSLFFRPYDFSQHEAISADEVTDRLKAIPADERWDKLNEIDPVRAAMLYPQDAYRVDRALKIWLTYGLNPSTTKPSFNPLVANTKVICIKPSLDVLRDRIGKRLAEMLKRSSQGGMGWIEEVESLLGSPWEQLWQQRGIIGYAEIASWVRGGRNSSDLGAMADLIEQRTYDYARRQLCFWRSFSEQLAEFDVDVCQIDNPSETTIDNLIL